MSRVKAGELNEDDFQKSVVASLDRLNEQVKDYRPPEQGNIFMQKVCHVIRYNINVCVQNNDESHRQRIDSINYYYINAICLNGFNKCLV